MNSKELLLTALVENNIKINLLRRKSKKSKILALKAMEKMNLGLGLSRRIDTKLRRIWTRVENSDYWEKNVPLFTEEKFKNTFRVDRATFSYLVQKLKRTERQDTRWRFAIPVEKRIAAVLYALGSSAEYRTVASLFGIGRTTLGELVIQICHELWAVLKTEVFDSYPPTQAKIEEIVAGFEKMGFPQCYGAIDGCHIEVNPPKEEAADHFNFKGWYSTVLFAAVDYRYRFTYVNVGIPGRSNDSTIFECSRLKTMHFNHNIFQINSKMIDSVDVPVLLIGDSAFKLSRFLMKPFPYYGDQPQNEKDFNKQLSRCRRVVENAFGHLKARFRKLGKGLEINLKNVPILIKSCCALHNLCNIRNDKINQKWLEEIKNIDKRTQPHRSTTQTKSGLEGSVIRNAIMRKIVPAVLGENVSLSVVNTIGLEEPVGDNGEVSSTSPEN